MTYEDKDPEITAKLKKGMWLVVKHRHKHGVQKFPVRCVEVREKRVFYVDPNKPTGRPVSTFPTNVIAASKSEETAIRIAVQLFQMGESKEAERRKWSAEFSLKWNLVREEILGEDGVQ